MPVPNSTAVRKQSQEAPEETPRRHFVSFHPDKMDPFMPHGMETPRELRALLRAEKAAERAADKTATKIVPSFDLLAGIAKIDEDFPVEDKEESKPVTLKVPGTVYATYRRVHSLFIDTGNKMESGELCTSCVYYWLKELMESREAQGMVEAFRDVETADYLDPYAEAELEDLIEDYRLVLSDPHLSTPKQITFRMSPGVDKYVSRCMTALRIEKASLVRPCLMKGLSGQAGCNPKNVGPFDDAYSALVASCASRTRFITRTLKGQLAGTKGDRP